MKKTLCLILCLCLISSVCVMAESKYENAITRVCGIGIMGNVADGDFRADDNITRAEFTTVALRLLGVFEASQCDTAFSDVPSEHWASGYICAAYDMGLISGRGEGVFAPEDSVLYSEAVKILICVLGRDAAMQSFEYPQSYLLQGGSCGLTKGVAYSDLPLTRKEVAALIDNAFDIYPLEPLYGTDGYTVAENTLFEKLSLMKETFHVSGVLMRSAHYSLDNTHGKKDGYIKVGDTLLKSDADYDSLLGYTVDAYYSESGDLNEAVLMAPHPTKNSVYTLGAEDTRIFDGKIYYYDESGKEKFYNTSLNTAFILNGDTSAIPSDFSITNGEYTLIDNNHNGDIDVIIVKKAESFIADTVAKNSSAVYFANNRTYHGKGGFAFDFNDAEKEYIISDKDDNILGFSDIAEGDSISIMGNSADTFVKILVSHEKVSGKITEMSDDEISIDSVSYPVGKDSLGKSIFKPYVGMEAQFCIDAFGNVIGTYGKTADKFTYGYIAAAERTDSLSSALMVKIVLGTEPKRHVKVSNGDETVSYYLQNDDFKVYAVSDSVTFAENPIDAIGDRISAKSIDPSLLEGKIAGFSLGSDGKIDTLNIYSVPANFTTYEFNADIFSFGGIRASRGFVKGENTAVVCIPNSLQREDDYGVRVQITDKTNVKVYGVRGIYENEYGSDDAYAEPMDIIIVSADMDSALPPTISADNEICIVGKVTSTLSEEGDISCKIELLNGETKEIYEVPSSSLVYNDALKLRKGDLIQFAVNSKSEITNVKRLASVQGLTDYTDEENLYGIIEDIKYNVYDYLSNGFVDRLSVNAGNNLVNVKIYKSEGQNIYHYNRTTGFISAASSDDIMASGYYGEKASKIFAYMVVNEAKVIVLIED